MRNLLRKKSRSNREQMSFPLERIEVKLFSAYEDSSRASTFKQVTYGNSHIAKEPFNVSSLLFFISWNLHSLCEIYLQNGKSKTWLYEVQATRSHWNSMTKWSSWDQVTRRLREPPGLKNLEGQLLENKQLAIEEIQSLFMVCLQTLKT